MSEASDWQTMKAGREMDRIIAERRGMAIQYVLQVKDYLVHQDELALFEREYPDSGYIKPDWCVLPHYSTDANAALTLLPLLHGEWFSWTLANTRIDLTYRCEINDFVHKWIGEGETAALAICRAWLNWSQP